MDDVAGPARHNGEGLMTLVAFSRPGGCHTLMLTMGAGDYVNNPWLVSDFPGQIQQFDGIIE